jgi:hypothetical protein
MPEPTRQKITFAEMRAAGVRGLLVYCSDYKCAHSVEISADRWPDHVRLSDLEPKFTRQALRSERRGRPAEFRLGARSKARPSGHRPAWLTWPNPNNSNVATVFLLRRTLG